MSAEPKRERENLAMRLVPYVVLLAGVLLWTNAPAYAGLCTPPVVQPESPYGYISSLVEALSYGKSSIDRIVAEDFGNEKLSSLDGLALHLFNLKLGKADYECAASQVLPYTESPNETIKTSAAGVAWVFLRLAELNEKSVVQLTALLNEAGEGKLKLGTALEKRAEMGKSYDDTWKLLVPAVIMATYAVVEKDPSTDRLSGLAMTTAQRDTILHKLLSTFGDEIAQGMQAGQPSMVGAGAALYHVIGLQKRRTR